MPHTKPKYERSGYSSRYSSTCKYAKPIPPLKLDEPNIGRAKCVYKGSDFLPTPTYTPTPSIEYYNDTLNGDLIACHNCSSYCSEEKICKYE